MNKKINNVTKKYETIHKSLEKSIQKLKEDNQKIQELTKLIIAGELTDEEIEQVREEIFTYKKNN